MRDRIKQSAEATGRSMNAEIVERLEDSFLIRKADGLRLQAREHRNGANAEALEYIKRALELLTSQKV